MPGLLVPPEIATAVAAKQAADDKKFTAPVAKLRPCRQDGGRQQAAADRAAHPSLLKRMMGVKPEAVADPTPVAASRQRRALLPAVGAATATAQTARSPSPASATKPQVPEELPLRPTLAVAKKAPPKAAGFAFGGCRRAPQPAVDKPAKSKSSAGKRSTDVAKLAPASQSLAPMRQPSNSAPSDEAAAARHRRRSRIGFAGRQIVKRKFDWPGDEEPTCPVPRPSAEQLGSTTRRISFGRLGDAAP